MDAFNAFFPLRESVKVDDILRLCNTWIRESQHSQLTQELSNHSMDTDFSASAANEFFSSTKHIGNDSEYAVVCYKTEEEKGIWTTEITAKKDIDVWCHIKVDYKSKQAASSNFAPDAKKPYIIKLISEQLGFGADGPIQTTSTPHKLSCEDLQQAVDIINGTIDTKMPFVFISMSNTGDYYIDPLKTAQLLSGMAHVYTEPNRYFSFDLRKLTNGRNPYAGAIGVFYPNSKDNRIIIPFGFKKDKIINYKTIYAQIRDSINLITIPEEYTYNTITNIIKENEFAIKIKNKDKECDYYIEELNKENKSLKEQLRNKENDITHLRLRLRSDASVSTGLHINTDGIEESCQGQILDVIMEALKKQKDLYYKNTRRRFIIESILNNNDKDSFFTDLVESIDNIMGGYRKMTPQIRSKLNELGIEFNEDGKHYKFYIAGFPQFTISVSKTVSDYRSGKNCAKQIIKSLL